MARIIAITNQKGGVAKTTTTHNLGVALTELGNKVLLIDCDPQANLTVSLNIKLLEVDISLADLLIKNTVMIEDAILETAVNGLDVICSNKDMAQVEEDLFKRINRENILRKKISQKIHDYYDYILLDSPPNLGIISNNILSAAQEVVIPVASEFYSLQGLAALIAQINLIKAEMNPDLRILGLLITRARRTNFSKQIADELKRFKLQIFQTQISESIKITEAPAYGKSVLEHDPKGESAKQYRALAEEITHNPSIYKK